VAAFKFGATSGKANPKIQRIVLAFKLPFKKLVLNASALA
jgi:hypothetical protein